MALSSLLGKVDLTLTFREPGFTFWCQVVTTTRTADTAAIPVGESCRLVENGIAVRTNFEVPWHEPVPH